MKDKIIFTGVFILLLLASFLAGRWTKPAKNPDPEVRVDTLWVRDTIHHDRPVYITKRVVDSIYIPISVTDSVHLHDTTFIILPREQKYYSDSTYSAWVSGYDPALDSIDVYLKTAYITKYFSSKPKHWHIGATAGYGFGKDGLTPYVGVGITYSLLSF